MARYAERKFILAFGAMAVSSAALLAGVMSGGEFVAAIGVVLGGYGVNKLRMIDGDR